MAGMVGRNLLPQVRLVAGRGGGGLLLLPERGRPLAVVVAIGVSVAESLQKNTKPYTCIIAWLQGCMGVWCTP